ncbi:hypothetical protein [Sphingomonas sp.]|uniref:hypothetical protein n=1 Tax=Sphingomonas sp. TaxID=28214 RepID=UPI001ED0989E|nr:hypothetical protein [Sphingomonas sp.]MBX3594449.1 hypothetical protein [Sphingomonas sp.]
MAALLCGLLPAPTGPAITTLVDRFGFAVELDALWGALIAGALGWHAARASSRRDSIGRIALTGALLVAAFVPGLGAGVLAPALLLSLSCTQARRLVAILVQCSALALLVPASSGPLPGPGDCFAALTVLLACWFSVHSARAVAANDNPLLKRTAPNPWLPTEVAHVTFAPSNPGIRGFSDVQ